MKNNDFKPRSESTDPCDEMMRAYAAMREWGDKNRNDDVLEGACEVRYLGGRDLKASGEFLRFIEMMRRSYPALVEFMPILFAEAFGGAENLAIDHGVTIPNCASDLPVARKSAIRKLAE